MTIQELKEQYGLKHEGRLICPICGAHKVHYRTQGYCCPVSPSNHTRREDAFTNALIEAVTSGIIKQADYDQYCFGE